MEVNESVTVGCATSKMCPQLHLCRSGLFLPQYMSTTIRQHIYAPVFIFYPPPLPPSQLYLGIEILSYSFLLPSLTVSSIVDEWLEVISPRKTKGERINPLNIYSCSLRSQCAISAQISIMKCEYNRWNVHSVPNLIAGFSLRLAQELLPENMGCLPDVHSI